ncbi:hypothetical protein V2E67_003563 [Citrobacter freundii]|nr:hypothetical protein [Citrobacter freundii]
MKERIYGLIDYENVMSLDGIKLEQYEKVIIFSGPLQDVIKLPSTTLEHDITIKIIRVTSTSQNNVDFHLVLELGVLSQKLPAEIVFHIISKDKGYDGVISFLQQSGRNCSRVTPIQQKPLLKIAAEKAKKTKTSPSIDIPIITEQINHLVKCCRKSASHMPSTTSALTSWLKSTMRNEWSLQRNVQIKGILEQQGIIYIDGDKLSWKLS